MMPTPNPPNYHLARLARLPDVASYLEAIVGEHERDVQWWIEDHFHWEFRHGGKALVPATRLGDINDLNESALRTILADFGVTPEQRLTIWWSDGEMATLPADLISRHLLDDIRYHSDDVLLCAPPDDWALFLYHEGQFSAGRADSRFVKLTSAEDCRRTQQWPPLDDRVPSADHQQELLIALMANRQAGHPPCSGVVIQTRGELVWLMQEELRSRPPDGSKDDAQVGFKRRPDLRLAIMRHANLDDVIFAGCYLSEADFCGANLTNAKFQFANAQGADFTGATLYRAHCYRANLSHAVLRGSCLNRANLRNADLTGADFTGAQMEATQMSVSALPQVEATATDTKRWWIVTDTGD